MRALFTPIFTLYFLTAFSQTPELVLQSALPGKAQQEYFLSKAERLGWNEIVSERKPYSSVFEQGNKKISYSSVVPVNYQNDKGEWLSVDIRPKPSSTGWIAEQQPSPVSVFNEGSFSIGSPDILYSQTQKINGTLINTMPQGRQEGQFVYFDNIVPGVTKQLIPGHGSIKYNYIIQTNSGITASSWKTEETIKLPKGFKVVRNTKRNGAEPELLIYDTNEKIQGGIFPIICFDSAGASAQGEMNIISQKEGEALIEIVVSSSWLLEPERQYPVIVDPLVTGPLTTWAGGVFPSCFFPNYYSDATINVFVPAGITVTNVGLTTNFYANPFSTTVMGEGRMYFSSQCGQTNVFQVQGTEGTQPGTAYLENFNVLNPLMCCIPQSCSSSNLEIRMHLSRTSNGTACNSNFLYYSNTTQWPFSAYVEGYTPEAYGSKMVFQPTTVCANVCDINARIYARYGVPPYSFTHPWGTTQVDTGNANGCSVGNTIALLPLVIPNCPNYCDPSTTLQVPAPVVTDACGAAVAFYDPFYSINIKPVPTLTPAQDTIFVCSQEEINVEWVSCLPGASVQWFGSGQSGTGFSHTETIENTSGVPQPFAYIATPSLNGCNGPDSEVYVVVFPYASSAFAADPPSAVVTNPINFTDLTTYNGNIPTGWEWTFGDGQSSIEQNPNHTYSSPGTYLVCLSVITELGCSGEVCDTITVVPAELELPNVVTPNGDNVNDILSIKYLEFYPQNKISVYNRWGNIVFEKKNYSNDWNPKTLSDGVYFYVLNIEGGKEYSQILHVHK